MMILRKKPKRTTFYQSSRSLVSKTKVSWTKKLPSTSRMKLLRISKIDYLPELKSFKEDLPKNKENLKINTPFLKEKERQSISKTRKITIQRWTASISL